jgi:hypothetical protein
MKKHLLLKPCNWHTTRKLRRQNVFAIDCTIKFTWEFTNVCQMHNK